tara:strand:+ start:700 stop:1191 length:492 start_codon:yes stop_codon:yes gene_type:complete
MINRHLKKYLLYFFILSIIFFLDRISKIYILQIAEQTGKVDIYFNSFVNFILVWNRGIGFGLFSLEEATLYNFITLIIILINIFIAYLVFVSKGLKAYFLLIILGGSLGNLFDRIHYSAVPDFIDVNYNGFHWFVFNIADIFITIGIVCLIFDEIILNKKIQK